MKSAPASVGRVRHLLEETAEELYEQAPCGYLSALPDGTIVRVNHRVMTMVGRPSSELVGRIRLQELLTRGGRIYYETHISPLLHMQGHVDAIALDLRGLKGPVPVLLNAVLRRDDAGDPLGIRATLLDVTERRRYEREILAARNDAEEASRVKSELVSMVSHDIRTPLAAVMNVGELLQTTELSEDQAKLVHILKSSTNNLLRLIDNALDLGKLEAGRMSLEMKLLDLRQLVESLVEELRTEAERKGLALHVLLDPNLPTGSIGDPIKLGRIISNLLGNAIKFTEQGGVHISVSLVQSEIKHVTVLFEIRDTGIGISKNQLGRIFDDFTQGSEEIGSRYGGSGLGLGICKKFLGLYGSKLQVESEPGSGSRFWFELKLGYSPPRDDVPPS
jgi:PAS domain S-box-containing protein